MSGTHFIRKTFAIGKSKTESCTMFSLQDTSKGPQKAKANSSEYEYEVVGTLDDRSSLSDEMADLCSKLPIYRVKPKSLVLDVEKQDTKRKLQE